MFFFFFLLFFKLHAEESEKAGGQREREGTNSEGADE